MHEYVLQLNSVFFTSDTNTVQVVAAKRCNPEEQDLNTGNNSIISITL